RVPMLSRAAEALFWIGRYAERAEDTARLLDVHFHKIISDPAVDEAETCAVVATVMGLRDGGPDPVPTTMREVLDLLAYDLDNPSAIAGALAAARENARGVRESLSGEIWECLNTTYLELPRRISAARQFGPAPLCSYVRHRAAMYAGYVVSTISRDAGAGGRPLGDHAAGVLGARGLPAAVPARGRRPAGAGVSPAGPAVPALGAARADRRRAGVGPAGADRAVGRTARPGVRGAPA